MTITLRAGVLNSGIQQNGTEFLTVDSSNNATLSNNLTVTGVATLAAGAVLGTPASGNLANCTGYPASSIGALTSGTTVATTSGTSIDFTGIPSWVKRVTVMFNSVSTNGVYQYLIQLGSGSILTTGYSSTGASIANTTPYADTNTSGFQLGGSNGDVTWVKSGSATFATVGSNIWQGTSCLSVPVAELAEYGAGIVTLGGTLDRIRITTVIGTETFDAGSINILYE